MDPGTRTPRIVAGSWLSSFWQGTHPLVTEIDVNEWLQFERPGKYVLHAASQRILRISPRDEAPSSPTPCELRSNNEAIEILPPDSQWEGAELVRITELLASTTAMTRLQAARDLRYLGTRAAAVALARWYLAFQVGEEATELRDGIFESPLPDAAQSTLNEALRSTASLPVTMAETLALLELNRQFANRPPPADSAARQAWADEHWRLLEALKQKYAAEIAQRKR